MDLIQKLHDQGDAGLEIRIHGHVTGRAVSPTVATVVTAATLATWKPEIIKFEGKSQNNIWTLHIKSSFDS